MPTKSPIQSRKHYRQITFSTVATVSRNNEKLAEAVASVDANTPQEVQEGSIIKAIYVELWTISSAADGSQVLALYKAEGGATAPTYANMVALDSWAGKKNILHVHQGLSANDGISGPMLAFKGWIKIPKGKQRFGLGDIFYLTLANPSGNDLDYCGFATYKEYQ